MIPWRRLIATTIFAAFAVGMIASTWAAEPEPAPAKKTNDYPPKATVGAIRMAAACMKCHDGNRGDPLGAFTYDLVRDPVFVSTEK